MSGSDSQKGRQRPAAATASAPARPWESRHLPSGRLAFHRHGIAYAALVLEGTYEEMSADGRYVCEPGMLIIHPPHHAHANSFGRSGARVLNVPLQGTNGLPRYRVGNPADPSSLERLMRRDTVAAVQALTTVPDCAGPCAPPSWIAWMADLLRQNPEGAGRPSVGWMARAVAKSPAHVSRTFRAYYGTGPSAYRRESRVRLALLLISSGRSLADVAIAAGFSDQSHLGRELKRATGRSPRRWRLEEGSTVSRPRSNPF